MTIQYQVQYRVHGNLNWSVWPPDGSLLNTLSTTVGANPPGPALASSTQYDFRVLAINAFGSTASAVTTVSTASGLTINSVALGNQSFTAGSPIGTVVGNITVTMSTGNFIGTLSVTGTDATSFQIVNGQLQLATNTTTAKTYSINIVATQASAANSPFVQAFNSIIGNPSVAESTDPTTVTTVGPAIIASQTWQVASSGPFNKFTLTNTGTPFQIALDTGTGPVIQSATAGVTQIIYHNHTLFQENSSNLWWYWNTATAAYVPYSITAVNLSTTTYTQNLAAGSTVATISQTLSDNGAFANTYTFQLGGTDAGSFTIVGTTLKVGASPLSAQSYSISITSIPSTVGNASTAAPFSLSVAGANVIPVTPPTHLPAGWQVAYFDDFTTSNTVTNSSTAPGFNWYINTPNVQVSAVSFSVLTASSAASQNGGNGGNNASSAGGVWTIQGEALNTYNGMFTTCPNDQPKTGANGKNNYWKHAYFETYMRWDPNGFKQGTTNVPMFPAFWSWSVSSSPTCEIDFMEQNATAVGQSPITSWGTSDPGGVVTGAQVTGSGNTLYDGNWHTYACLWQSTGTGTGSLQFYLDGNILNATHTRIQGGGGSVLNLTSIPTGSAAGSLMVDLENTLGMHMTIGTGFQWPIFVDWVRVWTATGT